jgi:hypothetical protein
MANNNAAGALNNNSPLQTNLSAEGGLPGEGPGLNHNSPLPLGEGPGVRAIGNRKTCNPYAQVALTYIHRPF